MRGINLGPVNRIAMPALRDALAAHGYEGVRTYVQSGNIVLDADQQADELGERIGRLIAERFGLQIAVVTRTRDELARVVAANPLKDHASDPKRYQVSFLSAPLAPDVAERLHSLAIAPERLVVHRRELYAWHEAGVARSKLWNAIGGKGLGVLATTRNWTTVTTLLELADA